MGFPKNFEDLTIADDFMFGMVMRNESVAKHFLEQLMGKKIKHIERCVIQSTKKSVLDSRAVRFDVEFIGDDKVYDIEMQQEGSGTEKGKLALLKRVRYYQSVLDNTYLKEGVNFAELPKTVIIFVCRFDLFGAGFAKYTQQPFIKETSKYADNHTEVIYLNSKFKYSNVETDIEDFLGCIENPDLLELSNSDFIKQVNQSARFARSNPEIRKEFINMRNLFEEGKMEGKMEGIEEGRMEGIEEGKDLRDKEIYTRCITVYGMTEEEARGIIGKSSSSEEKISKMNLKRKS